MPSIEDIRIIAEKKDGDDGDDDDDEDSIDILFAVDNDAPLCSGSDDQNTRTHRRHQTADLLLDASTSTTGARRRPQVRRSSLMSKRAMMRKTNSLRKHHKEQASQSQSQSQQHEHQQSSSCLLSRGNSLRDLKLQQSGGGCSRSLSPVRFHTKGSAYNSPAAPQRGQGASTCDKAILHRIRYEGDNDKSTTASIGTGGTDKYMDIPQS